MLRPNSFVRYALPAQRVNLQASLPLRSTQSLVYAISIVAKVTDDFE
jgi:hypothetical protein